MNIFDAIALLIAIVAVVLSPAVVIGVWWWSRRKRKDAPESSTGPREKLEASPSESPDQSEIPQLSYPGIALCVLGVAVITVGLFLPSVQAPEVQTIKDNAIIQSGDAAPFAFIVTFIMLGVFAGRKKTNKGRSAAIAGAVGVAYAIYLGTGSRLELEYIDSVDALGQATTVMGSPGVGIYAAGFGSFLAMIGGLSIAGSSQTEDVPLEAELKTCPSCAESVKSAAKVCRYCGFRFEDQPEVPSPEKATAEPL